MDKQITITTVIPTYNYGRYISRAIESVLAQERGSDEIIVVDDGSTDNTREAVSRFGDQVRYIFQENRGLSAARNTGIRAARSAWVAFLDADDWWLSNKLRLQAEALKQNPGVAMVYTSGWSITPDGVKTLWAAPQPRDVWPALRHSNCLAGGSSAMIRRDLLLDEGGFDETLTSCEDWDMWFRLARKYKLALVSAPVTVIAVWPQSMSGDYRRMLKNTAAILDKTLLLGLSGLRRLLWRRRIWSAQLYGAAITARAQGSAAERSLLWQSVRQWPSPWFVPKRWASLWLNLTAPPRRPVCVRTGSAGP